jgi:FMN reductase
MSIDPKNSGVKRISAKRRIVNEEKPEDMSGALFSEHRTQHGGIRHDDEKIYRITVVNAGVSDPSSTGKLGDAVALKAAEYLRLQGSTAEVHRINIKDLAKDIAVAGVSYQISEPLRDAISDVVTSDGIVAATPIFKASYTGLFKSFWDIVEPDAILNMPVALTATGGSPRHALVPDTAMRELFAFFRAVATPTSLLASSGDWASDSLSDRQERAGYELGALIYADIRGTVMKAVGRQYRRTYNSVTVNDTVNDAVGSDTDGGLNNDGTVDFDSALMHLAAGALFAKDDTTLVPENHEVTKIPEAAVSLKLSKE